MTEQLTTQSAMPAPQGTPHSPEQAPSTGAQPGVPQQTAVPGPRDANRPADMAPQGPSTAYEYPRGDRGAAATEHERQVRESLAGPSRDDTAREN